MKNKTTKNIMVATVALLGVSYILEKSIKNKKRQQEIERSRKSEIVEDNEPEKCNNSNKYILIGEVYHDVKKKSSLVFETPQTEDITDFSALPDRKYHSLPRNKVKTLTAETND